MFRITGSTYPAKNALKNAGFQFDATTKEWYGDEAAMTELKRISTASYSRANQKACAGLKIEEA